VATLAACAEQGNTGGFRFVRSRSARALAAGPAGGGVFATSPPRRIHALLASARLGGAHRSGHERGTGDDEQEGTRGGL
jgi:hypothetical protein